MLGYACLNAELREKKIYTNRTLRMATLVAKGYEKVAELVIQNLTDLITILEWNEANNIRFYRLSSEVFPFMSHPEHGYHIKDLPQAEIILDLLQKAGDYATINGHRITTHPGPFNVLRSPHENVVSKTILDLEAHAEIFDAMGFHPSHYNKINIHLGGAYGEKDSAMDRFVQNIDLLSDSVLRRLTIENDDRANLFSVFDLYHGVYIKTGIPIVFDYHHHKFNTGGMSEEEAAKLAYSTWPTKPVFHYSESKTLEQGQEKETPAHSDYIYQYIDNYDLDIDIMIEAKMKEQALFRYAKEQKSLIGVKQS